VWNEPYYRIYIDDAQNRVLSALETATKNQAIIRYGTPCFHSFADCSGNAIAKTVATNSHYQSPLRLSNYSHDCYIYRSPLEHGVAFSEPEEIKRRGSHLKY
jgi:hypothetical protein